MISLHMQKHPELSPWRVLSKPHWTLKPLTEGTPMDRRGRELPGPAPALLPLNFRAGRGLPIHLLR